MKWLSPNNLSRNTMVAPANDLTFRQWRWLLAGVIASYYIIVLACSGNFPIGDDYALLDFLNKTSEAHSAGEFLYLLFSQHNEHRIVTTRLLFLLFQHTFGSINFTFLCLLGNLSIFGIYLLFLKNIPENYARNPYVFLFITCMLFQYGSAESMLWAMASISNYLVLLFAVLAFTFFAGRKDQDIVIAMVFSMLAVYTQGNGLIVPLVGILMLLGQRRYTASTMMTFVTAGLFFFYFNGYHAPGHHSNPLESAFAPFEILFFAISFTGAVFGVSVPSYPTLTNLSIGVSFAAGLIVCLVTAYAVLKNPRKSATNILVWINCFVVLTGLVAALSRLNFGVAQALVIRYHVNSSLAIVSTGLLALQLMPDVQYPLNGVAHKAIRRLAWSSTVYLLLSFALVPYFCVVFYGSASIRERFSGSSIQFSEILRKAKALGIYQQNYNPWHSSEHIPKSRENSRKA